MTSSKLQLVHLRAEGFRGICDPLDVDFHKQTTVLSAPNGSGKTSILGSIEWALFGELQYQPKENNTNDELVNIRHRAQSATVRLDLGNNEGLTCITRSKRAGKRAMDVHIRFPDGQEYAGPEATTMLYRYLGLTFDDFYRAVYLHQESIRGLLIDDPRVRNEALDRLFGVEQLRDMLKALSGSTKPVRDALDKLESSQKRAVDRLTGALEQVDAQRRRALEDATKKDLSQSDLTFSTVTDLATKVITDLKALAHAANAQLKDLSEPDDVETVESFGRSVSTAIRTIRTAATNAEMAVNSAQGVAKLEEAQTRLRSAISDLGEVDSGMADLRATYGDPTTLETQKQSAQQEVRRYRDEQQRLGVAQRIVQDTLTFLEASPDQNDCPACGQDIDRQGLIDRLSDNLGEQLQSELESARTSQEQQQANISDLDAAIGTRSRLQKYREQYEGDLVRARDDARGLVGAEPELGEQPPDDDQLIASLQERKDALLQQADTIDQQRAKREEEIEAVQADMERLREIARFLRVDASYNEASSRLGAPDDDSSVAQQEIDSLSSLDSGIRSIAEVVTTEASGRASSAVEAAQVDISRLYGQLCNHPYFDTIQISVESQLVSGIERNNYSIRTLSSSDNRQTLASSRLSTAQMNCVALSVYLALAAQLQHNLGFVILDDPSQNLDTEHKIALVNILSQLAPTLQVIIGTQDAELDDLIETRAGSGSFHRRRLAPWSAVTGAALVTSDG